MLVFMIVHNPHSFGLESEFSGALGLYERRILCSRDLCAFPFIFGLVSK